MKKIKCRRAFLLVLTGVLFMFLFSGCGKPKYKVNLDDGFKSNKSAYAAGEKVTMYYDIIATDTDYSFSSKDVEFKQDYSHDKGYIFTFTMPAHDVTIEVHSSNSMMYIPPTPSLYINGEYILVAWEDNESVDALKELLPLEISMSMYGGFEQVGPVGQTLPSDDVQTEAKSGDIMLYSGDQLVIFYGSNSWSYTRLGHIGLSQEKMKELLSNGDVTVRLE